MEALDLGLVFILVYGAGIITYIIYLLLKT